MSDRMPKMTELDAKRYAEARSKMFEFSNLFPYEGADDRTVAIVGVAFLDFLLTHLLELFLVQDEKEARRLLEPEGHLGTFGAKVSACYCLGLVGKVVTHDLRVVAKVRNRFAHDLSASFQEERIAAWCRSLKWHRVMIAPPDAATNRDLFQVGVNQIASHLHGLSAFARHDRRAEFQPGFS